MSLRLGDTAPDFTANGVVTESRSALTWTICLTVLSVSTGIGAGIGGLTTPVQNDVFFKAPDQSNEKCTWFWWQAVSPEHA